MVQVDVRSEDVLLKVKEVELILYYYIKLYRIWLFNSVLKATVFTLFPSYCILSTIKRGV